MSVLPQDQGSSLTRRSLLLLILVVLAVEVGGIACTDSGLIFVSVDITGAGAGRGRVTETNPAVDLDCFLYFGAEGHTFPGAAPNFGCSDGFDDDLVGSFQLTATAGTGSTFGGWVGCSSVSGPVCTLSWDVTSDTSFAPVAQFDAPATDHVLAFVTDRDGNEEIYRSNADGSGLLRLTTDPGADGNPAWSPDQGQIAFVSDRDGNSEIYTMTAADGTNQLNRSSKPGDDSEPAWSSTNRIAFQSNRDGDDDIYTMDPDGGNLVQVTDTAGSDNHADWSPDGSKIAFDSDRDGDEDIYVMNADGTGVIQLTDSPGPDRTPVWSPDGTRIEFTSDRNGTRDIFVMQADGSGVTATLANKIAFSEVQGGGWSPDGELIAFGADLIGGGVAVHVMLVSVGGESAAELNLRPAFQNWEDGSPIWAW